jgi:N-acetyl-gamma-glutamyl-phosphate reductase
MNQANGKLQVGVLGATGFTGWELLRILLRHENVEVIWLSSESKPGTPLWETYPEFRFQLAPEVANLIPMAEAWKTQPDAVFSCLPHAASAEAFHPFLENGHTRVIDLSADYRLSNAEEYGRVYEHKHPHPEWLSQAVYGLTEIHGEAVAKAKLVANPGCYPTSALLPLIPLLSSGLISTERILIDSKSGVSGAGRKATEGTHYVLVNESFSAYKVGDTHRHLPEIREQLALAAGKPVPALFTPHLVPMERGILSTIYCELEPGKSLKDVQSAWAEQYQGSAFVHAVEAPPKTGEIIRTNECRFHGTQPEGGRTLIIVSVEDNMMKGASGQAVQNFNRMFGLAETCGLR